MIEIDNISKTYQTGKTKVQALKNLNCSVKNGELFGLIGPDGAGKTSLLRILTTLLLADEGKATVAGFDVIKDYKKIRNMIGYMPGRFSLYTDLSVEENLQFFATIFKTTIQENYHLIRDIYEQIEPFKNRKAGQLSGGMKQKLALCCALIHKPKVLLLDEPTTGVDVVSRKEFWRMLKRLKEAGLTIMVATPYMDEAVLCDRVALIQNGQILETDAPDQLIQNHRHPLWKVKANNMYALLQDLRQYEAIETVHPFGEYHHATPKSGTEDMPALKSWLENKKHEAVEMEAIAPNIEDIFMDLMQNKTS